MSLEIVTARVRSSAWWKIEDAARKRRGERRREAKRWVETYFGQKKVRAAVYQRERLSAGARYAALYRS